MSGKNKESEEWNFDIIPPKVGLISTRNHISEISGLLPTNYHMVKDSTILEPVSEEYIIYYAIRENNKTLLEIHPKENGKEIFSIVVLSSEYEIKNTVLRVGSTFGTLKKTFSIKDSYFNFTDGLYIFCDGFDGAFSIDLEGEGDDSPELLDLLPESRKIETIVVY